MSAIASPKNLPDSQDTTTVDESNSHAVASFSVFDELPALVIHLDAKGLVDRSNQRAQKILGSDLDGKKWRELYQLNFRKLDQGDLRGLDGRLYSLATAPLSGSNGQVLLLTDITETRRLQKRADQETRLIALGEMVARLAHQVRTPLSASLLYLGQLQNQLDGDQLNPDRVNHISQRLHERLHRMEDMVKDMLMFTQGRNTVSLDIAMDKQVKALKQELSDLFEYRNGTLSFDVESDLFIQGNPVALTSALSNLINNALEMIGEGAEVLVCISAQQEKIEIAIHDNGHGVNPKNRERIFEPFFTTRNSGNGLGLPVVKAVVENHAGTIVVGKSQHLGGACFTILLPKKLASKHREKAQ